MRARTYRSYTSRTFAIAASPRGARSTRGRVVLRLLRASWRRDRATDRVEHEDPAKGELRQGGSAGDECLELFRGLQAVFVGDARERLADVERFAVAIEVAVIVGGETRLRGQLAGEQP